MSGDPRFPKATYIGGLPAVSKEATGFLEFGTGTVIVGGIRKALVTVQTSAVVSVEVTGGQTASKSRAGKVAMFGVAGLLASKGGDAYVDIALHMRSGNVGLFRVEGTDPGLVRATLAPWVAQTPVAWHE